MNRCPSCRKEIDVKKYKLYICTCGAKLLPVPIHKKLTIQDVTVEYDKDKNTKLIYGREDSESWNKGNIDK